MPGHSMASEWLEWLPVTASCACSDPNYCPPVTLPPAYMMSLDPWLPSSSPVQPDWLVQAWLAGPGLAGPWKPVCFLTPFRRFAGRVGTGQCLGTLDINQPGYMPEHWDRSVPNVMIGTCQGVWVWKYWRTCMQGRCPRLHWSLRDSASFHGFHFVKFPAQFVNIASGRGAGE